MRDEVRLRSGSGINPLLQVGARIRFCVIRSECSFTRKRRAGKRSRKTAAESRGIGSDGERHGSERRGGRRATFIF
jgi:hypothetical protein